MSIHPSISAKVLADSIGPSGDRLTTLELCFPRSILAEFNTRRVFSRNAASSRAIPVERMIRDVERNPFIPISWGKNQRGMQAGEECNAPVRIATEAGTGELVLSREDAWLYGRDQMVQCALAFAEAGYHKQLVNRLLEPWMWAHVVVSATAWSNFLALRDHPDAEPHMHVLAGQIRYALETSEPKPLQPSQWHLPFVDDAVVDLIDERIAEHGGDPLFGSQSSAQSRRPHA